MVNSIQFAISSTNLLCKLADITEFNCPTGGIIKELNDGHAAFDTRASLFDFPEPLMDRVNYLPCGGLKLPQYF